MHLSRAAALSGHPTRANQRVARWLDDHVMRTKVLSGPPTRPHGTPPDRCRRAAGRGAFPVSTEGGTRRVQLVREGGGGACLELLVAVLRARQALQIRRDLFLKNATFREMSVTPPGASREAPALNSWLVPALRSTERRTMARQRRGPGACAVRGRGGRRCIFGRRFRRRCGSRCGSAGGGGHREVPARREWWVRAPAGGRDVSG